MLALADEPLNMSDAAAVLLTQEQIEELLERLPGWTLRQVDGIPRIEKTYKLKDFAQALALTNRIGELAEQTGHHPALLTEWGKVTVSWWTHFLGGLHRNDLIMAARTEQLAD